MFPNSGAFSGDLGQYVSRPAGAAATTQDVLLDYAVTPGVHLIKIDFLADTVSGSPLATAQLNVQVQADGTVTHLDGSPLGTIAFHSTVTELSLSQGQQVEVGETSDLTVVAYSKNGISALAPGAVTLTATSGSSLIQLNANGSVTGLTQGQVQLRPSVDGLTGTPTIVTVLPAPVQPLTIDLASNDFVLDSERGVVWVATPDGFVRSVSTATGALGTSFKVGGNPSVLALSDDGSTLYAGLKTAGAIRKIDLTTHTLGLQFALPPSIFGGGSYAIDLGVQPGHPSTIAVSTQQLSNSGAIGATIFDNGVKRTNSLGLYEGTRFIWMTADRLLAWDVYSAGTLRDLAVDANGVSTTQTALTGPNNVMAQFTLAGDKLYDQSGLVLDAATLARIDAFDFSNIDPSSNSGVLGVAVDLPAKRAYFAYAEGQLVWLQSYDTDTLQLIGRRRIANVTTTALTGYRQSLVRTNSGLALRLSDKVVLLNDLTGL